MKSLSRSIARALLAAAMGAVLSTIALGQTNPTVFAVELVSPQGIEVDTMGRVWVAEQGTGNGDARISMITPAGEVHPFITSMPSNVVQGMPEGAHHLLFRDGMLWAAQGLGELSPEGNLLRIDTSGFSPGSLPLGMDDVDHVEDVGTFVVNFNFADDTDQTNIYNMAFGPNGDLYLADASANAVIRREAGTGTLSVLATLPRIPNPTPVGPPMIQAVPTGIVFSGETLLVSTLPGFPMPAGEGRIYEIDLDGNVAEIQSGFTTIVDLALDPHGNLVVAQFGGFDPSAGFTANAGSVVRLTEDGVEALASGLNFPAGIAFAPNGDLYVTAFTDGQVLKMDASTIGTATEPPIEMPDGFALLQNYPNPFNPSTSIEYRLGGPEHVVLTIHNVLGQEVRRLVDERIAAGVHTVAWDGMDGQGRSVPSGVYLYRLRAAGEVESRAMHLVK